MKTTHTPGPWEINPIWSNEQGIEIHNTETTIANVQSFRKPFNEEEMNANAKLIAAAPEMLEALVEAKRMYEAIEPAGGWQGVYEEIKSAIKQATT